MAVTKKQLANLRPIKKGQVLNPLGAGAHDPELRALKRLTAHEVAEIGSMIVQRNLPALQQIIKESKDLDSKHSALKVWMATIAIKGISKGDSHALDTLLNRITGRVKEKIELTGADGGPVLHKDLTETQLKERAASMLARMAKRNVDKPTDP